LAISSSVARVEQFGHEEDEAETDGPSNQETSEVELKGGCSAILASASAVGSLYSCAEIKLNIQCKFVSITLLTG
jgi:hypothetical protein